MARDEWFRRKTWSAKDREEFHARLSRGRSTSAKAQYVRVQASHLLDAKEFSAALELLDFLLRELPEPLEVSIAHFARARCLVGLSRVDEALSEYRLSLQAERKFPQVGTSAWLELPWLIMSLKMSEFYAEALSTLDEFHSEVELGIPILRFRYSAVRAIIAAEQGDALTATKFARQALEAAACTHSGYVRHPKLGLVDEIEPKLRKRLISLSRGSTP